MDGDEVVEVCCHHVADSIGRNPPGMKVSGVIHWVPATPSLPAEVRLYDRLFLERHPDEGSSAEINPDSVEVVSGARLEPSLLDAMPGSRWQLERVGYFAVDAVDSQAGAPVLNRIATLRDSWQGRSHPAATPAFPAAATPPRTTTRPPKRSRIEYRAEGRSRDPLLADRFANWPSKFGLVEDEVDLLTGDRETGDLFEDTVQAGARPGVAARWIINELPRELGDRALDETPLTGGGLASLIEAVESGEVSGPAGKDVFAVMLRNGGEPRQIIAERGLTQINDETTIAGVVNEVLSANPDKVDQYRGGKIGLMGFFVGQVVRATQGKANPQVVQRVLGDRLN
jgi:glutaminyl-tRNA synthetase